MKFELKVKHEQPLKCGVLKGNGEILLDTCEHNHNYLCKYNLIVFFFNVNLKKSCFIPNFVLIRQWRNNAQFLRNHES